MKTIDAVQHILDTTGMSKYALAKSIGLTPPSVDQYLKGVRMSQPTADKFFTVYNIKVTDAWQK